MEIREYFPEILAVSGFVANRGNILVFGNTDRSPVRTERKGDILSIALGEGNFCAVDAREETAVGILAGHPFAVLVEPGVCLASDISMPLTMLISAATKKQLEEDIFAEFCRMYYQEHPEAEAVLKNPPLAQRLLTDLRYPLGTSSAWAGEQNYGSFLNQVVQKCNRREIEQFRVDSLISFLKYVIRDQAGEPGSAPVIGMGAWAAFWMVAAAVEQSLDFVFCDPTIRDHPLSLLMRNPQLVASHSKSFV